jgi:hypothetical protein
MATITDVTYYQTGINFIPNAQDISASDSPSVQTTLEYFIGIYERELMLNALGPILYDEFLENIVPPPQRPQKWTDLIEGSTYVLNDKTYIWEGLRGYNKNSLVASYIFCKFLRNDESTYTTTGIAQNTAKNAQNYSYTPKYISAWRQFIEKYQAQADCSPVIIRDHFGNVGLDYYQNNNSEVSLYRFLTDQNELDPTAFPDFEFKFYENQNSLGI